MRKAYVALGLAALWSIGLLVAAVVAPVYSSSSSSSVSVSSGSQPVTFDAQPVVTSSSNTLVEVNGVGVLGVVAIPLLAVDLVAASLRRRRARGRHGVGAFAWTVVVLLSLFTLVAMLSIGIFVVPVTGLVILACVFALGAPDPDPPARPVSSTGGPEFRVG